MQRIITSALLFAAVTLFVRHGYAVLASFAGRRAERDAEVYAAWSKELFLGWSDEKAKRLALWAKAAVVLGALLVLALTGNVLFAATAAAALYWAPLVIYRVARERRLQRLEDQLPDAVNVMVSSVRAGRSLPQAIEDVAQKVEGPAGQEFGVMAGEYNYGGMGVEGVLDRARARLGLEGFTMITSALIITSNSGGDVLEMLERVAEAIRELSRLKKKIRTETSEVRAQEKVILLMTPLFGALICLFDPSVPDILFHTWVGTIILLFVIGCQVFSVWWIHRIIKSTI